MLDFEEIAKKFDPLIKKQIKQLNIYYDHQEYYQIGLIALWDATQNFDPKKGVFPSFAQKYIRGRMLNHLRKERNHKDKCGVSLEPHMFDYLIKDKDELLELNLWIEHLYALLSEREQLWLQQYLLGKGPKEIANEQNVSLETVKSWRKNALKKLRKYYNKEYRIK